MGLEECFDAGRVAMTLADLITARDKDGHAGAVAFRERLLGVHIDFTIRKGISWSQEFERQNEMIAERAAVPHHDLQDGAGFSFIHPLEFSWP